MKILAFAFLITASLMLILPELSDAQQRGSLMGAFSPRRADLDQMRERGFLETGLKPVYPKGAECLKVTSPFGSGTRSDGSARTRKFYNGYHGGTDIPAKEGTPILAIADGKVVHKVEGMGIGGIGIILQHRPQDTGLDAWTYTEYKHLTEMPSFPIGHQIRMGEVIDQAGTSGTTGGYYGAAGFSHLHLAAFYSQEEHLDTPINR